MSIGPIDQNPLDDDAVTIVDPGDTTVEPSYGHDTQPWDTGGHADPDAENITHMPGVSRGREIDAMDFFDLDHRTPEGGRGVDPDAAFKTGTDVRPDRYVHDEALQVRPLLATAFVVRRYALTAVPQLIAPENPNRIMLRFSTPPGSVVDNPIFIGPNPGTASLTAGFPVYAGNHSAVILPSIPWAITAEVWASGTDPDTMAVYEAFRTDVDAQ